MLLSKKKDLDLTSGPLFKTILLFALPIMLANVVATLFNAADMAVLSWFAEGNEIASVGATSSVISLFTQFAVGLCTGVNIVLARLCHVGKNYAIVVLWDDGDFDRCYCRNQCLGKLFQRHKAVAHDGFRLKEHLLELFHSLICYVCLGCVARLLVLLCQNCVALGNLLTCQKVTD